MNLQHHKIDIINLYKSGKSCKEISLLYNVCSTTILNRLKRWGIQRRKRRDYNKYYCQKNIFDEIDNQDKAYWLGFLVGDGSVRNNTLKLELSNKDYNHLEKFKNFMCFNGPIVNTAKNCCMLSITNCELIKALSKNFVVPNKTYKNIQTPNINTILLKHFYRGILDSDGWISQHKLKRNRKQHEFGFSSYYKDGILQEIQDYFSELIGKRVGYLITRKRQNQQTSQLIIGGNNNFIKIYDHFYSNSTTFLVRKRKKADSFIKDIKGTSF